MQNPRLRFSVGNWQLTGPCCSRGVEGNGPELGHEVGRVVSLRSKGRP